MSVHPWQKFEMALVTLQLETPFLIGAAESDNLFDAVFVTDANGLPCIPGESLAGVLRHALAGENDPHTDPTCQEVFGFQLGEGGESSRVRLSFAQVHNAKDRPVPFRGAHQDEVLSFLRAGVGRDHVRIGPHGVVDGRGKFDELLVPAGARFTFELCVSHLSPKPARDMVALLRSPFLRLGRASRRGLGRIRVERWCLAEFELPRDAERLARVPVALHELAGSAELKKQELPKPPERPGWSQLTLTLKPRGSWMIGGGLPTDREPERQGKNEPWDRLPLSERRVAWNGSQGRVEDWREAAFLVPGSAVKGAVRHRAAFHARRAAGQWLEKEGEWPEKLPPIDQERELFGEVRDRDDRGEPGRVLFSDLFLAEPPPYVPLQHVSLDRFTQGPVDHLLYDELALGETTLNLELAVHARALSEKARKALWLALKDLVEGRLALGAGRGHGRFEGSMSPEGVPSCEEVLCG